MRMILFKFFVLIVLVFMSRTLQAQEVFYVYRSDGSIQVFEQDKVDSMFCSQIDLFGEKCDEFVTQEIWTVDSIYRIPITEIDSVVFNVNHLQISDDFKRLDEYTYHVEKANTMNGQFCVIFSGLVPNLKSGEIVVLETDTIAYLRRITEVVTAGGYVTLSTQEAFLSDLFPSGSFVLSTEPSTAVMSRDASGNMIYHPVEICYYDNAGKYHNVLRSPSTRSEFEKPIFSNSFDYSGQTLHETEYTRLYWDKCWFNCNLDLVMSFNFHSKDEGWELYRKGDLALYKAALRGSVDANFSLRFDAKYEDEEKIKEIVLKRNVHRPIAVKFNVYTVPIVLALKTDLFADGSYSCQGNFSASTGFDSSAKAELGLSWTQAEGLKTYSDFESNIKWNKPTIEGDIHLEEKLSVFPRLNFTLYGLVGPSFDIKPYMRHTFDLGFWDKLGSNPKDFYGSEYKMYTGYDGAASINLRPLIGDYVLSGPIAWNISDSLIYSSPYELSFKEISSVWDDFDNYVLPGQTWRVTFTVKDYDYLKKQPCNTEFPLSVKFETNSGKMQSDFANVNVNNGEVFNDWLVADVPDNEKPYIQATLYNSDGKVLLCERKEFDMPRVKTLDNDSVNMWSAVIRGSVTSVPKDSFVNCRYGFIYSTNSVPSVDGKKVYVGENKNCNYSYTLTDLNDSTTYYYCAFLEVNGRYLVYGDVNSFTTKKKVIIIGSEKAVDLGLSVKWAGWNIGASHPEDYGGYYAWGELKTKRLYDGSTYQFYDPKNYTYLFIGENISGTQYDVAHMEWGNGWRMPTHEEFQELVTECDWEWISYKGVNGYAVTSANGNSIFLPASGVAAADVINGKGRQGRYWSSSFYPDNAFNAYSLDFNSDREGACGNYIRCDGFSIRPVLSY